MKSYTIFFDDYEIETIYSSSDKEAVNNSFKLFGSKFITSIIDNEYKKVY